METHTHTELALNAESSVPSVPSARMYSTQA